LAEKVKAITDFGSEPAFNFRISEFQAAVGLTSLRRVEENNRRRREIAKQYNERLGSYFYLQKERGYHVYHVYSLRHPKRDILIEKLQQRGIGTKIYYDYLLHEIRQVEHFPTPNAEKYKKELFALPMYPSLSNKEVDFVIKNVLQILEEI
jgi:dTDP-4-amino-4,6-dideoxygalactose transaminase